MQPAANFDFPMPKDMRMFLVVELTRIVLSLTVVYASSSPLTMAATCAGVHDLDLSV